LTPYHTAWTTLRIHPVRTGARYACVSAPGRWKPSSSCTGSETFAVQETCFKLNVDVYFLRGFDVKQGEFARETGRNLASQIGNRSLLQFAPESEALPSVGLFAECLLSGTRQRRLCRDPHSVKLSYRQRASLPSAGHSAQDPTRQRHICRVFNTRQRQRSPKGRQRPSPS
jgi:hypothetical protein